MGIEYKAKLLVGLPFDDLSEILKNDDVCGQIEELNLEYASPWYDSPIDEWVIGVTVCRTNEWDWDYVDISKYQEAFDKFKEITGLTGKLILSPHGY